MGLRLNVNVHVILGKTPKMISENKIKMNSKLGPIKLVKQSSQKYINVKSPINSFSIDEMIIFSSSR